MSNHEPRKIGPLHTILAVGGACLAIWVFSSLRGTTQQMGTTANLSGIQCAEGRATSLGVNALNAPGLASGGPVLTALDQSGVGWARLAVWWGRTEQKQGVYNWRIYDAAIAKMLSLHVNPLVVIMGPTPCYSLENPVQGCTGPLFQLPKKQDWSNFVSAVVARYKDRVQYWEIWNEPNLPNMLGVPDLNQRLTGYRDLILIPGAEAVHAADPSAKVVAPVFGGSGWGNGQLGQGIKLVLKGPVAQMVNVVSFHSYFPGDINGRSIEIRNAMRSLGIETEPIWLTEAGLDPGRYGESREADFLKADLLNLLASGNVQKVFLFELTDSRDRSGKATDHWGIVDDTGPEFKPRPAYTVLQRAIQSACH